MRWIWLGTEDPAALLRRARLVVLAETAVALEPAECTALGKHDDTPLPPELMDDLKPRALRIRSPVCQRSLVGIVGPDGLGRHGYRASFPVTVLQVCRLDRKRLDQAERVDRDVALSPDNLL